MQCVSLVFYTLLFNGYKVNIILPQRGVSQGDILFPYLFLLCSNVLSCMLIKLENENKFKPTQFARRGPKISDLMYADDTVLFCDATLGTCNLINNTMNILLICIVVWLVRILIDLNLSWSVAQISLIWRKILCNLFSILLANQSWVRIWVYMLMMMRTGLPFIRIWSIK